METGFGSKKIYWRVTVTDIDQETGEILYDKTGYKKTKSIKDETQVNNNKGTIHYTNKWKKQKATQLRLFK